MIRTVAIGLLVLVALQLFLYQIMIDDRLPSPDRDGLSQEDASNSEAIRALWEGPSTKFDLDLRVGVVFIAVIVFTAVFATLFILYEEVAAKDE